MHNRQDEAAPSPEQAAERLSRLKAFLAVDPGNERLIGESLDLALVAGDYDFVLQTTATVLARSPQDMKAAFDRATALIGKHEYTRAIECLEAILARDPNLIAAQVNLGLCQYQLGDFSRARQPLENAYQSGDRSPGLLRLLVSTYHHLGLMQQAVGVADANPKPATADPALAGVYALVYLDSNLSSRAAKWAARAVDGNPDSVDGLTVQATLNAAKMHVAHAREQYERVAELAPNNGRAWVGLGTLALLSRDLPRAKSLLARGLQAMPRHVGSWHVLAWAQLLSGEIDEAEKTFNRSLELDRNFAETHGGLASVAALRGDRAAAEHGIEVALRLDPKCLSAQFARSVVMSRSGDPAAGRKLVRETLAGLSPGDASLLSRVIEEAAKE